MKRTAKFARFVIAFFAFSLGFIATAADDSTGDIGAKPAVTQRP